MWVGEVEWGVEGGTDRSLFPTPHREDSANNNAVSDTATTIISCLLYDRQYP